VTALSESTSRRLFVVETLLVAAPLSLAYLWLGSGLLIPPALTSPWWPTVSIALIAALALVALIAAWTLVLSYLSGGAAALRARGAGWWTIASLGAVIVLAAFFSALMPASREYSPAWAFRQNLELFGLGAPLVLPLAHLVAERRRRVARTLPYVDLPSLASAASR